MDKGWWPNEGFVPKETFVKEPPVTIAAAGETEVRPTSEYIGDWLCNKNYVCSKKIYRTAYTYT